MDYAGKRVIYAQMCRKLTRSFPIFSLTHKLRAAKEITPYSEDSNLCVVGLMKVSMFLSPCFNVWCFVLFCDVSFCYVSFCYVSFRFGLFCFVMLCFVLLCFALLCFVLVCFVLLCYVMFCYVQISLPNQPQSMWISINSLHLIKMCCLRDWNQRFWVRNLSLWNCKGLQVNNCEY